MALEKERIQTFLAGLAFAGTFHSVSTDPNTHVVTADVATVVAPQSAVVNEISQNFTTGHNRRVPARLDSGTWLFEMLIAFGREVTLEPFLQTLIDSPPLLPSSTTQRQVRLVLDNVHYRHPTQQQPAGGTAATLTFRAKLTPK